MSHINIKPVRRKLDSMQLAEVLLDLAQEQQRKGRRPRRTTRLLRAIEVVRRKERSHDLS